MQTIDDRSDEREARREQRLRELGTRQPRCTSSNCGESDPFALTGVYPHTVCYECQASRGGKKRTEHHHLAGAANDPQTAAIPANDHRILSEMQAQEWPTKTLRNPDGNPLLQAAASLRGWLDYLRLLLERTIGWIPPFLERLNEHLEIALGANWWVDLGCEGRPS